MQTIAAPLEGLEIDGKYAIGTCIAEGERQSLYETTYNDRPAIIKIFRPGNSRAASDLLAGFAAAKNLQHPHLIAVYDFGHTTLFDARVLYVVAERADENLATVLRGRPLDDRETRDLLNGIIPALEYLHAKGLIHSRIRPSNVLACGETVKLSADRLLSLHSASGIVAPPGLHDAPETGAGLFTPAADVWSMSVLTLEALTGSPLESSLGELRAPFREIVEGGMIRDPEQRWPLRRIAAALNGETSRPHEIPLLRDSANEDNRPRYRKFGGIAIGGAIAAGALCAFLIRGAHHAPPPPPKEAAVRVAPASPLVQAKPAPVSPAPLPEAPGWAIVGAAYRRRGDAEKRAAQLHKEHPALEARVYPNDPDSKRYLVVFGSGLSEPQAKRQLDRARRAGAPAGTYMTKLR